MKEEFIKIIFIFIVGVAITVIEKKLVKKNIHKRKLCNLLILAVKCTCNMVNKDSRHPLTSQINVPKMGGCTFNTLPVLQKKRGGGYFHFGTVSNHISALDPTISRLWIQPYLGTVPNHISILYLTISRYCTPPCLGNVPHHVSVLYPTKSRYCLWLDTVLRCGWVQYQNVV